MFDKMRLKKQSQGAEGQIGAMSVIAIVYGIIRDFMWRKNKANQSQSSDFAQDRFISVRCSAFSGQRQDGEGWMMDGSALVNRLSFFLASIQRPPAGGKRKIVRNICPIRGLWQFSAKKGCILRAVRIQYTISEAFSGRPIRTSYSRIVGLLEVSDYGRNVLFLTGSRRKTQS